MSRIGGINNTYDEGYAAMLMAIFGEQTPVGFAIDWAFAYLEGDTDRFVERALKQLNFEEINEIIEEEKKKAAASGKSRKNEAFSSVWDDIGDLYGLSGGALHKRIKRRKKKMELEKSMAGEC